MPRAPDIRPGAAIPGLRISDQSCWGEHSWWRARTVTVRAGGPTAESPPQRVRSPARGRDGQPDVVTALNSMPLKNEKYSSGTAPVNPSGCQQLAFALDEAVRLAESRTAKASLCLQATPASFPHTFAAEYLSAGVPIETVSSC